MSMELNKALELLREIRPSIPKEVLELWCKDRDAFLASHPAVEQAGGDERAAFERFVRKHCGMPAHIAVNWDAKFTNDAWEGWKARAALAHRAPEVCSECSDTGKVYDESGDGPWSCYACTGNPEVIGYANGDELDNMLDDRTAVLSPGKTSFHTVPVYRLIRAALAQPSQSQYEASFEEWLANELEGEDGQPVPAAVCDIALARRAFNHWPKLEHPAKVGGVRFSAGVSSRLVVEAAQRLYEFESTPEKEAERIERLQAFREQLDPLNLAPHAEAFNEAPADALRPEQAEAERPEVAEVAFVLRNIGAMDAEDIDGDNVDLRFEDAEGRDTGCDVSIVEYAEKAADLFEQHDRIVGELRADRDSWAEQAEQRLADWDEMRKERDAALARVAELEKQDLVDAPGPDEIHQMAFEEGQPAEDGDGYLFSAEEFDLFVQRLLDSCATTVAQAQHSVPDGAADLCRFLAKLYCELDGLRYSTAKLPAEQIADALIFKWPVLQGTRNQLNIKRISEQPYDESKLHSAIAAMLAAAPSKEVGHE
ncbi:hypothetical protein JE005_16820 [Pseudomonas aeruginosa]|nr:hypothetical protein [Pseudomonas aeruginosa]